MSSTRDARRSSRSHWLVGLLGAVLFVVGFGGTAPASLERFSAWTDASPAQQSPADWRASASPDTSCDARAQRRSTSPTDLPFVAAVPSTAAGLRTPSAFYRTHAEHRAAAVVTRGYDATAPPRLL